MSKLKYFSILILNFIAGLAGNLIAGWIQQDIWTNLFTTERIAGTVIAVILTLMTIGLLDSQKARKLAITGNVFSADGNPIKGALVFVDGVDRQKETDPIGWFRIEVDERKSWVVRASYEGKTGQVTVTRKQIREPVNLTLTEPKVEYVPSPSLNDKKGVLLWYNHSGRRDGRDEWDSRSGVEVGHGWHNFDLVFPGEGSVIYAVQSSSRLLWYRHDGWQSGSVKWSGGPRNPLNRDLGQFKFLFSGGEGIIYVVRQDGKLIWYNHTGWRDGRDEWDSRSGVEVDHDWHNFDLVFPGEGSTIYARVQPKQEETSGKVSLQAYNGQYVCAENGGGRELVVDRNGIGPWEEFDLIELGENKIGLRAWNGQFVSVESAKGQKVVADRNELHKWETFDLIELEDDRVALRTWNGKYWCAEGGGGREIVADRDGIGIWETFKLIRRGVFLGYFDEDSNLMQLPDPEKVYRVESVKSGKVMDVHLKSLEDNAEIVQYEWHGGRNQLWRFIPLEGSDQGYYYIRSVFSEKCLDVLGVESFDRKKLHQMMVRHLDENEVKIQVFYLEIDYDNLPGSAKASKVKELIEYLQRHNRLPELIRNLKQSRLDVQWSSALRMTNDNLGKQHRIVQRTCQDSDYQKWKLIPGDTGSFFIQCKHNEKVLDVLGSSIENNVPIIKYSFNGGDNQRWKLVESE